MSFWSRPGPGLRHYDRVAFCCKQSRVAEICHFRHIGVIVLRENQNVLRLDVAVDDTCFPLNNVVSMGIQEPTSGMQISDRESNIEQDAKSALGIQLFSSA